MSKGNRWDRREEGTEPTEEVGKQLKLLDLVRIKSHHEHQTIMKCHFYYYH